MLGIFSFFKRLIQRLFRRTPHATVPSTPVPREQTARKPMIESVESRLHLSGNGETNSTQEQIHDAQKS